MSKKSIGGIVLSIMLGLVGIYFVGRNNTIAWLAVGALAITVFLTCKSVEKDKLLNSLE